MSHTLTTHIQVKASPEMVWEALTSPEIVRQYFFGTQLVTTWEVGTPIFFRGEWEGTPYEDKGTVLEFVPLHRLRYNYWSSFSGTEDIPANYANITQSLDQQDGLCIVTIQQDGIENEEKLAHSEQNWLSVMGQMKAMLESEQGE